jgi:anaerobic C4-dicarboxylate transporter
MKIPLIVASGQGIIPLVFVGFPSVLIGVVCLAFAGFLTDRKKEEDRKFRRRLAIVGAAFLALALISPMLDPVVLTIMRQIFGH